MPSSQAAGTERRNERMITHEPPKLKTTLKTPPKQATNPLQFVKVGPCSLYRTAQEQLQKVQEVKKIKQEIRDDPEDWQSNLDNWKSSRRKRQEHIIERVVEVKKLELEEHDRQRRRSKTFSEMMEERGNRGRKLSISLAMYHEEDANDLSDLGIGTSSGKSSISGDTHDSHDDAHSVLSDRDSEIEKNHSDVDNASNARINDDSTTLVASTTTIVTETKSASTATATSTATAKTTREEPFGNGFGSHDQEYDSAITATASSPEPEEYTYEGAIRGYVSRVSQNIPRRTLADLDAKLEESKLSVDEESKACNGPSVKIDIGKRREIFEKASQRTGGETKPSNRLSGDFTGAKSIKERLSSLEKQKQQGGNERVDKEQEKNGQPTNRLSGDMSSIRERLSHLEKEASERENRSSARHKIVTGSVEVEPSDSPSGETAGTSSAESRDELTARSIKDRLNALDATRVKSSTDKRSSTNKHGFREREIDRSSPRSERSSSPDSEYYASRADFLRSLDSLDADASSGPDTFERALSLEELDLGRRYPTSSSSAELLNDTDREDSGIHTADVSCSVSQADEPVDEDIVHANSLVERRETNREEKPFPRENRDTARSMRVDESPENGNFAASNQNETDQREAKVVAKKGTAETSSGERATNKPYPQIHPLVEATNISNVPYSSPATSRPVVYQSPKVPPRRTLPESTLEPRSSGPAEVDERSTSKEPPSETKNPQETSEEPSTSDVEGQSAITKAWETLLSGKLVVGDQVDVENDDSRKIPPKTLPKPKLSASKGSLTQDAGSPSNLETPAANVEEDQKEQDSRIAAESLKPEAGTSEEESTIFTFGSAILRPNNSASSIANAEISSSSSSLCSLQESSKTSSPSQTPSRLASKIPTPLARKAVSGKPLSQVSVSSPTSPTSPSLPRTLSPKTRTSIEKRAVGPTGSPHNSSKLSEIPVFVGSSVSAQANWTECCENSNAKSSEGGSLNSSESSLNPQASLTLSSTPPKSLIPSLSSSKHTSGTSTNLSSFSATNVTEAIPPSSPQTSLPACARNSQGSSIPSPCSPKAWSGSSTPSSPGKPSSSLAKSLAGSSIPVLSSQDPSKSANPCLPSLAANPQKADRRRTVVEVCEKVVVPRGETLSTPPVTPFITVERVGDKRNDAEVSIDSQQSALSRKS